MVGGVPDSYFGDNVVYITLNVLNTSRASEPARDAWRTFTLALIAALAACAAACGYAIYRRRRLAGIIAPTKIKVIKTVSSNLQSAVSFQAPYTVLRRWNDAAAEG
jgi:ABC-type Fe3+ transport system permease subunit